jgi:hypothetical protein
LEHAGEVIALDNNQKQIDYFRKRLELLRKGDFERFLDTPGIIPDKNLKLQVERRNTYFRKEGRMEKIQQKLSSLKFSDIPQNMFKAYKFERYNKLYLSTLFTYTTEMGTGDCDFILLDMGNQLPKGGLIYLADYCNRGMWNPFPSCKYLSHIGLEIDEKLTSKAKSEENTECNWSPSVLRRIK